LTGTIARRKTANGDKSETSFSMHYFTAENIFIWLFHASNLMAFLAFLLRDQLHLRVMMALSLFLQGLYYYAIPGGPFFDPLFWKVVSFAANAIMIVLVFGGRLDYGIPNDLRALFDKISVLSPGQFRKLVKESKRTVSSEDPLLVEGQKPQQLHYLLRGFAEITKGHSRHKISSGVFLGEVAFLNSTAASATVHLGEDAECVTWDSTDLQSLMAKDKAIDIAMRGIFNHDLASKVANSVPLQPPVT
jgi:Popeye protein conserved region